MNLVVCHFSQRIFSCQRQSGDTTSTVRQRQQRSTLFIMASQDPSSSASFTPPPPTTTASSSTTAEGGGNDTTTTTTSLVSEQIYEFLLSELVLYAKDSCTTAAEAAAATDEEERLTVAAEMASAKLERMGFAVGYRLTERLAQNKTWNTLAGADVAAAVAAQQLEAVKFLCKEVWLEIFRKQIDKLQTNHRGVFVLKDLDLRWLQRFPAGTEQARVTAIRLLAFPCGLIRGCLSNLGIPAVVSCDFLVNGQNMSGKSLCCVFVIMGQSRCVLKLSQLNRTRFLGFHF